MKVRNAFGIILLVLLLIMPAMLSQFPVVIEAEEPEPSGDWDNRYSFTVDYGNGTYTTSQSIGPQVFWDNEVSDWNELKFEDLGNGYLLENSMITVYVYEWYTVFYDPDNQRVSVDDERWIVEVYWKNNKWREVDLYDPSLSYSNNGTHLTVTRSFDCYEGEFNVTYILWQGARLKHDVKFISKMEGINQFRVIPKFTGIYSNKVKHSAGNETITSEKHVISPFFIFGEDNNNLVFSEYLWKLGEINESTGEWTPTTLLDVILDTSAQGSKMDIIIGNYTLAENESLLIDPDSDTWQVGASNDDTLATDAAGPPHTWDSINTAATNQQVGRTSSGDYLGGGMRFTGITIAQGASISSAYLKLTCRIADSATVKSNIDGEAVDDAVTFTTVGNYNGRARTGALVAWDSIPTWTLNTLYTSPDIQSVIQEIVDRGGWESGNDLVIFWEDDGTTGTNRKRRAWTYDSSTTKAPKLEVTWTLGSNPPTVTTLSATLIEETTANPRGQVTATGGENPTRYIQYGTVTVGGPVDLEYADYNEVGYAIIDTSDSSRPGVTSVRRPIIMRDPETMEAVLWSGKYWAVVDTRTNGWLTTNFDIYSSTNLLSWTEEYRNIVAEVGSTWEDEHYAASSFSYHAGDANPFLIFYCARESSSDTGRIRNGAVRSDDMETWTKNANNPLFEYQNETWAPAGTEVFSIAKLSTSAAPHKWIAIFEGDAKADRQGIGIAYNDDTDPDTTGWTFACRSHTSCASGLRREVDPWIFRDGDRYYIFYEIYPTTGDAKPTGGMWADEEDVFTENAWTRFSTNPILGEMTGDAHKCSGLYGVVKGDTFYLPFKDGVIGSTVATVDLTGGGSYPFEKNCGVGGTGIYNSYLTGLTRGEKYYYRAKAVNSGGTDYGSEMTFITKPNAPTGLNAYGPTNVQISLSWSKGTGAYYTYVRRKVGSYPTSITDGNLVYSGTGTTKTDTGRTPGIHYYYRAWSRAYDGGWGPYSDGYSSDAEYTKPSNPSSLSATMASSTQIDLTWTKGTGGDKTHIRRRIGTYPTSISDGAQAYFDTGVSKDDTGLGGGNDYYYRGWAYDTDSGYYSSGYTEDWASTNQVPVNDLCDSDSTFDVDTYGWVKQTVTDADGVADLKTVDIQVITVDSKVFTLRWTQNSNTFSEVSDPDGICTLDAGGSQRVNIDSDTDRIEFKFKISAVAQKGYSSVQATVIDDVDEQDQDNYPNEFSINFYVELSITDGSHGWSGLSPGDSDILITSPGDGDIDLTITTNADFDLQAKGDGALATNGYTIPLVNVEVHKDTLGSAQGLTTSYADIGGLTTQTRGVALSKSFKLWITVPSPLESGEYSYSLAVQGVES